jgi:hypothetical protein
VKKLASDAVENVLRTDQVKPLKVNASRETLVIEGQFLEYL